MLKLNPWKLAIVAVGAAMVLDATHPADAQPRAGGGAPWGQGVRFGGQMVEAVAYAATQRAMATRTPTPAPTVDHTLPLPAWMPAGVLTHEATIRRVGAEDPPIDPLALAILVAIECPSGNTGCTSYVGARGLGQIMPATALALENQTGHPCTSAPYDAVTSLRCGKAYYIQGLRAASALWAPNLERYAIGAAGIGYNGGNGLVPRVVAHVQAGGHVCDAPVPAESRRWCTMALDMWARAGRQ